jgi:predicted enzyme related to lactoylglutathione lyase
MAALARVTGIGGVFFKARDPAELAAWYHEHLGVLVPGGATHAVFAAQADGSDATGVRLSTVWAPFPADTEYFGPGASGWMVNYRVADLDAMLSQLRATGVWVADRVEESEFGRFGWAADPEGNRFELWEPPRGGLPPASPDAGTA